MPFELPGAEPAFAPDRVVDVKHIRLEVSLDFADKRVDGVCTLTLSALNDGPTRATLNAVEMSLHAVVDPEGEPLAYEYDGKQLVVDLGERQEGEELQLILRYSARPRRGLYFIAPDAAYPDRPTQVWSQGQDEDNRHWFPCFDHPHEKSSSEMLITVPGHMVALSNGALVEERRDEQAGTRSFHFKQEVPHASYLITLVAGDFAVLTDQAEDIELFYYVPRDRKDDAVRTFEATPRMMKLFAELAGQPYPWGRYSQVAVAEFIFGGMENTSATTLTDQTLHDARAHLDFSSEPLVAHELAHQWFGDLLTCRTWSEGWLNEGFATYFEILWKEHSVGRDDADYDRQLDLEAYLDEAGGRYQRPIVTNVYHEPIDVFDRHLYEKGAAVLHMLRTELGDARFWKAVRLYVARHQGGSVETRDLVRAIEDATGWNGDRFFRQWVHAPGHPDLAVEYAWDDGERLARISVKQKQAAPAPTYDLPLVVRFVVAGEARDVTLRVRRAEETFVVAWPEAPSQVIVDPGNHLLKTLDEKKPSPLWRAQLASAERAIDRVRAARGMAKAGEITKEAIDALAKAMRTDGFWAARGEAALALGQLKTEAARQAIAEAVREEAHPKARRLLVRALGQFRHDEAAADAALAVLARDASYFVEAEAASTLAKTRSHRAYPALVEARDRRSFLDVVRSACFGGMAELRDERGLDLAIEGAAYGQPPAARRAAIAAMGALGALFPSRKAAVRERLVELLEDGDFRARIAAVEALRALGDADAVGALKKAERDDLDGRVRRRAREVAKALAEGAPQADALRTLREAVEKLEGENRDLKERLLKLEVARKEAAK